MLNEHATRGETAELRQVGEWVYANFPRLIEIAACIRMNKAKKETLVMNTPLITIDNEILGGTPVFTGTRVPVAVLFENLAGGLSLEEILESYPTLKREQAIEALHQAESLLRLRKAA